MRVLWQGVRDSCGRESIGQGFRCLPSALALLLLTGCGTNLEFNDSQNMTREEMLSRATLVFAGVIRQHTLDRSPMLRFRVPGENPFTTYWKVARRDVDIETIFKGEEPRRSISVYEIYWTGGASGDWNSTQDGERALFLVYKDHGRYHLVRDWWRSIFPIRSGSHKRMPMDDSHPFWERFALMNWWYPWQAEGRYSLPDPNAALSQWRTVRLLRGLLRHPNQRLRTEACRELLSYRGVYECYDRLSATERAGFIVPASEPMGPWGSLDLEQKRIRTTVRDPALRAGFCRLWRAESPTDNDTGCDPANPYPAAIVTEQGDVPLSPTGTP